MKSDIGPATVVDPRADARAGSKCLGARGPRRISLRVERRILGKLPAAGVRQNSTRFLVDGTMIAADRSGLRARNVREPPPETRPTFEQSSIAKVVRSLDAYPKVQEDYVTGSTAGGIITFVCAAICALLFLSEYAHHRTTTIASEVKVDTVGVDRLVPNADRLRVHIDVTFHALACELITLDTMDQAGEEHHDVHEGHLKKRRLDRHGEPIEKEYTVEPANKHKVVHEELEKMRKASSGDDEGHQGHTMTGRDGREETLVPKRAGDDENTDGRSNGGDGGGDRDGGGRRLLQSGSGAAVSQQDAMQAHMMQMFSLQALIDEQFPEGVQKAFKNEREEGCEVIGHLEVNRVPGSFSVSPGRGIHVGLTHLQLNVRTELNLTHTINKFAFGEGFPGFVSPLDGYHRDLKPNQVHQYFLKVVPTSFTPLTGQPISSQQYSVTESTAKAQGLMGGSRPSGVYFHYELSPIRVDYKETRNTFGEFLTGVCAVVGGVATMSGLVHKGVQFVQSQMKPAA